MKRKLSLLDSSTGETFDIPIYLNQAPQRQRSIYGTRWLQMSQDPLIELAKDKDLSGLPHRVLLYLLGHLDFENYVAVSQTSIAQELETYRPNVTKALKKLIDKKILIAGPKAGRSSTFRLNPAYGWKGDNKKAQEYQLELVKGGRE